MKFNQDLVITTPRLILRPFNSGDLLDFHEYASVPGVGEMAGWNHHQSIDETREILTMFIEEGNVLAIIEKESNKVIGSFGVHDSSLKNEPMFKDNKMAEIGYVLARPYWGNRLMSETVTEVLKYLFVTLDYDIVSVSHFDFNNQSRRVIVNNGFTFHSDNIVMVKQLNKTFMEKRYYLRREQFLKQHK